MFAIFGSIWAFNASLNSSNVLMYVLCVSVRTRGRPFSFVMSKGEQHAHQSINHPSERYYDSCNLFDWINISFFSFPFGSVNQTQRIYFDWSENSICFAFALCAYEIFFVSLPRIWSTFAYFIANDWLNKCKKSKSHLTMFERKIRNEPRIDQIKSVHIFVVFSFPFANNMDCIKYSCTKRSEE